MASFNATTVDDMIKSFPTHQIERITGRPSYEKLKPIIKELHKCAAAIPSITNQGHLHLTTTDAQYLAITGKNKDIPTAPTALAPITSTMTQFQLHTCQVNHREAVRQHHLHQTVDSALKKLLTKAIDDMYFSGIKISKSTTLDLIQYLKSRYYKISENDLKNNDLKLREVWDFETPIENYFKRIEECRDLAKDAEQEYSEKQIIQIMMIQMKQLDAFKLAIREWKRKIETDKTIENFRIHFTEAYDDLLEDIEEEREEKANNVMTSEILNQLLEMNKEEDIESDTSQNNEEIIANNTKSESSNEKLLDVINQLIPVLNNLKGNLGNNLKGNSQGQQFNNNNKQRQPGKMAWRRTAPKEGEATTKNFEGVEFEWCGNCRGGKGLWTKGAGKHNTAQHDPTKRKKSDA